MCGIVLAAGAVSSIDLDIFNQLLYCDVFRGVHSTGVMAQRVSEPVRIFKAAIPSAPFLETQEYRELSEGETKYVVSPCWLVGHNRHATRGAINAQNAHPFQHGNITLVHNGTLTDQGLLPDSSRFVVDSENICYSIDKIGAAETIQKLDGAYTLIWHDASDKTLHIIRNNERPFHLARCGTEWFGASEEDMLMWILKRSKSHKNRIGEHFECEVGVEYVFDVSGPGKKCQLKEQIKHTLPTFTYASRRNYNYSRGWDDYYNQSGASQSREASKKAERDRQNAVAEEAGIKARIDQRAVMIPHTWFPYSAAANGTGRITGYVFESGEYYEVDCHNCSKGLYETCMDNPNKGITGTITCINKIKDTVRLIITGASICDVKTDGTDTVIDLNNKNLPALPSGNPDERMDKDEVPFDTTPDSFIMPTGLTMTKELWGKHDHSKCGGCDKVIPWAVASKAAFAYNCFWHKECLENVMAPHGTTADSDNDQFLCDVCGVEKSMKLLDSDVSSERMADICTTCAKTIKDIKERKAEPTEVLCDVVDKTNGNVRIKVSITKLQFDRMIRMRGSNVCSFKDLHKAHIEKRGNEAFAYKYGSDGTEEQTAKAETFQRQPINKSLRNGQSEIIVTKAYWVQIGQCCNCFSQIPWRDVENCSLTLSNQVVCPTCRGE